MGTEPTTAWGWNVSPECFYDVNHGACNGRARIPNEWDDGDCLCGCHTEMWDRFHVKQAAQEAATLAEEESLYVTFIERTVI